MLCNATYSTVRPEIRRQGQTGHFTQMTTLAYMSSHKYLICNLFQNAFQTGVSNWCNNVFEYFQIRAFNTRLYFTDTNNRSMIQVWDICSEVSSHHQTMNRIKEM